MAGVQVAVSQSHARWCCKVIGPYNDLFFWNLALPDWKCRARWTYVLSESHYGRYTTNPCIQDVFVVNSPAHCFAILNQGPLLISGVTVDDCAWFHFVVRLNLTLRIAMGNYPNSQSNGVSAGQLFKYIHIQRFLNLRIGCNTDGFDVSGNNVVIRNWSV